MIIGMKRAALAFVAALTIAITVPPTAHAGTLTIHNKNCTKTANWSTKKRVRVRIYSKKGYKGCFKGYLTVHVGDTKSIEIRDKAYEGQKCGKYRHEAVGTIEGPYDVHGDRDSSVTCKKDWLGVCQCTKD